MVVLSLRNLWGDFIRDEWTYNGIIGKVIYTECMESKFIGGELSVRNVSVTNISNKDLSVKKSMKNVSGTNLSRTDISKPDLSVPPEGIVVKKGGATGKIGQSHEKGDQTLE